MITERDGRGTREWPSQRIAATPAPERGESVQNGRAAPGTRQPGGAGKGGQALPSPQRGVRVLLHLCVFSSAYGALGRV